MRFGFGVLRLSSDAFWTLTPRELAAAMPRIQSINAGPPDRALFEALMVSFPDDVAQEVNNASSLS